jgi:hypothetical protein
VARRGTPVSKLGHVIVGVLAAVAAIEARAAAEPGGAPIKHTEKNDGGVIERARVEVAPSGHAFTQISIDNPLGDVRVEGYDGTSMQIETRKHAPDEDALDRLRVSLVPNPDGTVRITTTADPSSNREAPRLPSAAVRIDLIVRAPRNAKVEATVAAGKLEVEAMDAGGELDTASGSITVKNVSGELWTHSVSGPTSLAQVFGSVDAATISADVDLDTISGDKLVASANHGRIAGRRVRSRDIELTTIDGKIVLEAEAALHGRISVASMRGDIDVRLHRHDAVVVRARGTKVDLGAAARMDAEGWQRTSFGLTSDNAALVELRSPLGLVQFAIVE